MEICLIRCISILFMYIFTVGTIEMDVATLSNYDVNLDVELDVNEAIILLKFLVHIIDAIPYTDS